MDGALFWYHNRKRALIIGPTEEKTVEKEGIRIMTMNTEPLLGERI